MVGKKTLENKAKFSLDGWQFKEWLIGNIGTLKELFKVGLPLAFGMTFFVDKPGLVFFITGLGKLVLDTAEYWIKPREL